MKFYKIHDILAMGNAKMLADTAQGVRMLPRGLAPAKTWLQTQADLQRDLSCNMTSSVTCNDVS